MITLLSRLFISNRENTGDQSVRRAYGMLCSVVGIAINLVLFSGKYLGGALSGSVAIIADAFNNLSDAGSSIITLVGFKFSGRRPDLSHPFGHGRVEYICGLIVAGIILIMGVELAKTSIDKIQHPQPVEFSVLVLAILVASIAAKGYMFFYNDRVGKKLSSAGMRATALDSLSDTIATTAVLLSMIVSQLTALNIDGWCGLLVSLFILFAGYKAASETISPLLGQSPDQELIDRITELSLSFKEIINIHDLVVHDYGPGRMMISLHAEVPGDGNIFHLHEVVDRAELLLAQELNCEAVIHMDPVTVNDDEINAMRAETVKLVQQLGDGVSLHDFRMVKGPTRSNIIFDVVVPHELRLSEDEIKQRVHELVAQRWDNVNAVLKVDRPFVKHSGMSGKGK